MARLPEGAKLLNQAPIQSKRQRESEHRRPVKWRAKQAADSRRDTAAFLKKLDAVQKRTAKSSTQLP